MGRPASNPGGRRPRPAVMDDRGNPREQPPVRRALDDHGVGVSVQIGQATPAGDDHRACPNVLNGLALLRPGGPDRDQRCFRSRRRLVARRRLRGLPVPSRVAPRQRRRGANIRWRSHATASRAAGDEVGAIAIEGPRWSWRIAPSCQAEVVFAPIANQSSSRDGSTGRRGGSSRD